MNSNSTANQQHHNDTVMIADDALSFFNDVFTFIPENYRHITKEMLEPAGGGPQKQNNNKQKNKNKQQQQQQKPQNQQQQQQQNKPQHQKQKGGAPLSLLELKEKAQQRIQSIQAENREKSQQKIRELTQQHQLNGQHKAKEIKKQIKQQQQLDEDDVIMASGDEGKGPKRDPSQAFDKTKKEFKSKGKVSEDKMKNKQKYKEAKRKMKEKSKKGLASTGGSEEHSQKQQTQK